METRDFTGVRRVFAALTLVAAALVSTPALAVVIDFGDRVAGDEINGASGFASNGIDLTGSMFAFTGGGGTTNSAVVFNSNDAGGAAPYLSVNNILVNVDLGGFGFVDQVSFRYADFGGSINLAVNGILIDNAEDFTAGIFGGVTVSVTNGPGGPGIVTLSSADDITSIGIGGQELAIDDITFEPAAVSAKEPSVLLLLGVGVLCIAGLTHSRRRL